MNELPNRIKMGTLQKKITEHRVHIMSLQQGPIHRTGHVT